MPVARYCKNEKMGSVLEAIDGQQPATAAERNSCLSRLMVQQWLLAISSCPKANGVLAHLPNYLTESDWSKFRQHILLMDAMALLIRRMKQMGLVSLKETCKKQALALLLH